MQKVKRTIEQYRLFADGERILVGVSGGADSVALLFVLHELAKATGWELHVAHVEHGLRGEESIADARFVEELCRRLDVAFHLGQPNVKQFARQQGVSTQVAARELRYRFFQETARKIGAGKLALAHHADDQAETVLMRILRGTSVSGLAGIPLRRQLDGVEVVRPFLHIGRKEIEAYCEMAHIPFRMDASNASTDYLRNKIRLQLLPLLQSEYNGNIKQALLQLGRIAADEDRFLQQQASALLDRVTAEKSDGRVTVRIAELLNAGLALQRRAITLILYYLCGHTREWEAKHIEQILRLAARSSPSAGIDLPGGIRAWREYGFLHIGKQVGWICPTDRAEAELAVPEWPADSPAWQQPFAIPELDLYGTIELLEGSVGPANRWQAVFDYEAVRGQKFLIRTRRHGDSMRPHGMPGRKKIKDVLMEARIPKQQRDCWPIWLLADEIVWVTGIRRAQLALVRPETRRTLRIRVDRYGSEVT